jgi:hypothetical protein
MIHPAWYLVKRYSRIFKFCFFDNVAENEGRERPLPFPGYPSFVGMRLSLSPTEGLEPIPKTLSPPTPTYLGRDGFAV